MTVTFVLRLFPPRCERLPVRELVARVLERRVEPERPDRVVERVRFDRELVDRERPDEVRRLRDCEPPRLAEPERRADDVRREEDVPLDELRERLPVARLLVRERPLRDWLPRERELLALFRPERDRLRLPLDAVRRLVLRERVPLLRRELDLRDVPRCERPRDPVAFSRLTSLLKLLFCPPAVWSCTSKAKPLSSNFWNHSSHSISSSEPSPL